MLTPRYVFADDFRQFYEYFLSMPHTCKTFHKGEVIWKPGQPHEAIHYIVSGSVIHYADHESGRRKIISFHGAGTVFPGYHQSDYKIELSLSTSALSDVSVLEFTRTQFRTMFESNRALSEQVVNWYSMYVNLFLFETVHQEYNSSLVKLCNLLYLLASGQASHSACTVDITQEDLADMLGLSRVQITRGLGELRKRAVISTGRGKILVQDLSALAKLCTSETL